MSLFLGIDAGTVSLKWVLTGPYERLAEISARNGRPFARLSRLPDGSGAAYSSYRRIQGTPLGAAVSSLGELFSLTGGEIGSAVITGASSPLISRETGIPREGSFKATAAAAALLYPGVEHVFEMGGENSSYIRLARSDGHTNITGYETNGDCAAGTGSFLDQQASRLRYRVEDIGAISLEARRSPRIAGRCSVFAKSDMIHAQQKGYRPEEVLKGLCEAVARNFKSTIARGSKIDGRAVFVGGVAMNEGVVEAMRKVLEMDRDSLLVPDTGAWTGALGAALLAAGPGRSCDMEAVRARVSSGDVSVRREFPAWPPLSADKVTFLRDMTEEWSPDEEDIRVDGWLGIDIGSVSTNLALVDDAGRVISDVYLRTDARPIEAVSKGLEAIQAAAGDRVIVRGVGTTGSGRELIGEIIGADTVRDEITAHKTGAVFIADKMLGRKVDTIFEIGGQDSKYIRIEDGIVVDFAMNEACAAGTGSFLEEQADKLDVRIVDEFSRRAFLSEAPVRLGERCTVYMEHDVTACLKRGAERDDLIAGLSYSVVQNYLNRVVRGRKIGETIFFQGGTAYNDAVASAFSMVLGREIIVPPHNGVIGAVGAALLAREKVTETGGKTTFRGFDISKIDYSKREFTCNGCSNTCEILEFTVMGQKTYWGDKCSDRFRKRGRVPVKASVPDLVNLYLDLLERDYGTASSGRPARPGPGEDRQGKASRRVAGIPRAMYYYDSFPFWRTYLEALGFEVVVSPPTTRPVINAGLEETVAEPCAPVQAAHGHAAALLEKEPDLIFLLNVIDAEPDGDGGGSYICPWGQTLPFVLREMNSLQGRLDLVYCPTVRFREGPKRVERRLWDYLAGRPGGGETPSRKRHREAVSSAYEAQRLFEEAVRKAGLEALGTVERSGEHSVVVVGRPYNIFDRGMNLDIPSKLREYYGVNVVPLPFLPLEGEGIEDVTGNMFWAYGRKILKAARFAAGRDRMHLVYLTNFKCGPDSYVKHFCGPAAERPFLALQFDGHGNDAGVITRCEAFLESKGVLSWWKKGKISSMAERFTSRGCPGERRKPLRPHSGTWG